MLSAAFLGTRRAPTARGLTARLARRLGPPCAGGAWLAEPQGVAGLASSSLAEAFSSSPKTQASLPSPLEDAVLRGRVLVLQTPVADSVDAASLKRGMSADDFRGMDLETVRRVFEKLASKQEKPSTERSEEGPSEEAPKSPQRGKGSPQGLAFSDDLSHAEWRGLAEAALRHVGGFLANDLVNVYTAMASSGLRDAELQKALHLRVQELPAVCFSPCEAASILKTLQFCQWRSVKTVRHLGLSVVKAISEASPSACREVLSAYAQLRVPLETAQDKDAVQKATSRLCQLAAQLEPKDLALSLNALTKLRLGLAKAVTALAPQIPRLSQGMSAMHLSLTANALAVAGSPNVKALRAIEAAALECTDTWVPQDVANLVNAFCRLDVASEALFSAAATHTVQEVVKYGPQNLTLVVNAFSKMGIRHGPLFSAVSQMTQRSVQKFKSKELGVLAMAFARADVKDKALVASLADEAFYRATVGRVFRRRDKTLDFQSLQQLASALAKMGLRDPRVFHVFTDCAKRLLRKAFDGKGAAAPDSALKSSSDEGPSSSQLLASLALGLSQGGVRDASLNSLLERRLLQQAETFSSLSLAVAASSAIRLGIASRPLYEALMAQAEKRLFHIPVECLVSLLVSFARSRVASNAFLVQSVRRLRMQMLELSPTNLTRVLTALQETDFREPVFLSRASRTLFFRRSELSARCLCGAFSALSKLAVRNERAMQGLQTEVYARLHSLRQDEAGAVLYALMLRALDRQPDKGPTLEAAEEKEETTNSSENGESESERAAAAAPLEVGLVDGLLQKLDESRRSLSTASVFVLQLVHLTLRFLHPEVLEDLSGGGRRLLERASSVNLLSCGSVAQSSRLHRAVSRAFVQAGIPHTSEVQVGPFSLDLVLENRVCIEVDGPQHYYRNTGMLKLNTRLKHRLLKAMGWTLHRITFWEWEQLSSQSQRVLFCALLAKKALGNVPLLEAPAATEDAISTKETS